MDALTLLALILAIVLGVLVIWWLDQDLNKFLEIILEILDLID